ncbi:MAG TPA: DUF4097 family beta strand repeat-containing protein [Pseudonocardiaceae bacterium]|jgi:DUF4097 and DUF4098 domain-containing protein YvlB|nr:DUF4097 family beta strand repeat-containing protein [Pseudonocardiaceae bacterium]
MPTFDTPDPISATIEVAIGDVRITASARTDTIVDVRPSDGSHDLDVRAAEQTRVEFTAGRLLVKAPKQRGIGVFGKVGSIDVTVELPIGSSLQGDAAVGAFRSVGRLGDCRIKIATGDIQLDETGAVDLTTVGTITVDQVTGHAEVRTGTGKMRLGRIDGTAVLKNANGDILIGEVTGELRANTSNGDISVDSAAAGVNANSANGDVRVTSVTRGSASLKTGNGEIEIGIRAGTAARLDVHTQFGRVRNELAVTESPEPTDETVDVRARTGFGDIVIRRS